MFPRNNESDYSDKKRSHEVRELKVHAASYGDELSRFTPGQLLSLRARTRAKAGFIAQPLGNLSTSMHAFGMIRCANLMFQALNLLRTRRTVGRHAMLICCWLGISKANVQLYTFSK